MGRIAEEEVERIKGEVELVREVERQGVELRRVGRDLVGRCPFHEDGEPSLVVTPGKNLWHCLGECQTGGSVIDWVMRAEGVSFRHAVELLRERHPHLAASSGGGERDERDREGLAGRKLGFGAEGTERLLNRVVRFYHLTLKQSGEAREYLKKRGLDDEEMVEHFQVGYANRTLAYRLSGEGRGELRGELQGLGILRESGHEHFNGSLVIPVFDGEGRVVEIYGRKVGTNLRKGTPKHLYLPGPHRGIFNRLSLEGWYGSGGKRELIVCESLIDALTFWVSGYRNVTSAYGVEGFTEEHRNFLGEQGIERVLIAYDSDAAGDKAAEKLSRELEGQGIESLRVRFPKGMDANEYALKTSPAKRALWVVLEGAEAMSGGGSKGLTLPSPSPSPSSSSLSPVISQSSFSELTGSEEQAREGAGVILEPIEALSDGGGLVEHSSLVAEGRGRSEQLSYSAESDEVRVKLRGRQWRIRGLSKSTTPGIMRVNVMVRGEAGFFVDSLDLYSARQRANFLRQAASELSEEERQIKGDMGELLLSLEILQGELQRGEREGGSKAKELSGEEEAEALSLLKSPELLARIEGDLGRCGLVGERRNKLLAYLAASSRKLAQPLAVVVQSSSAAGKSSLMDAVLRMMPEEERVQYSAMTGQSLFYMGETNLSHKILAIAEEEGAERASYALKLLQSEGELTIASTGKDPVTGRLVTEEYRVEGPVMIFLTTTALEVDEELLNRCLVLTVDETREQTQAIHERQRRGQTLEGILEAQERSSLMGLHQNAQRLLRPLYVVNPYAGELTFSDGQTRTRRDHMKYLTLIQSIALLHQYQREVKRVEHQGAELRYIEVKREDIALADELSWDVLRPGEDQLPTKTRELLGEVIVLVQERARQEGIGEGEVRFTRRELRERTQLGDTQLKLHLGRLVEMEHLSVQRGRHEQRYVYSLTRVARWGVGCGGGATGRGAVGARVRPVLVSESIELGKPVGVVGKVGARQGEDGESYVAAGAAE